MELELTIRCYLRNGLKEHMEDSYQDKTTNSLLSLLIPNQMVLLLITHMLQLPKTGLYLIGDCVRKLTPIEAERLQTLPDNYTDCVVASGKRIGLCGNGWTVDVIAHIFKGLVQE